MSLFVSDVNPEHSYADFATASAIYAWFTTAISRLPTQTPLQMRHSPSPCFSSKQIPDLDFEEKTSGNSAAVCRASSTTSIDEVGDTQWAEQSQ